MALTKHNRLTVADLRKLKGKRQLTMLFVETPEEAAAAAAARIDILSIVEHAVFARDARGGGRLFRSGRPHLRASTAPTRTICAPRTRT